MRPGGRAVTEAAARRVTKLLRERVGEGLRTVVTVGSDDFEVHYLRDDLAQEYSRETFAAVVDTFRLEQPQLSPGTGTLPVGERRAVVHYHEEAFVVQLPVAADESVLVSLTPDAGRDLLTFLETCRRLVQEAA